MKIFRKKDKVEKLNINLLEDEQDNKEYEEYMEEKKSKWLEERDKKKTKKEKVSEVAKGIGAGIGVFLMFAGTGILTVLAAMLDNGEKIGSRGKDWREDDDLFNDIDYSLDSEEVHNGVKIALDMTDLNDEEDCAKTYLWMYQNIDNMPQTVKTVIGMTKGRIRKDRLEVKQTDVWRWYSDEQEVAQKAIKQLNKYYEKTNDSKVIIVKE